MKLRKIAKKMVPSIWLRRKLKKALSLLRYKTYYEMYMIASIELRQEKAISKIKKKSIIKVVFFVSHSSQWKYDSLYFKMKDCKLFEPLIIISPDASYTNDKIEGVRTCYKRFSASKYNAIKAYNENLKEWIDVRKEIDPDIIFFSRQISGAGRYFGIEQFANKLTCYVPYSIFSDYNPKLQYDLLFHNLCWKYFVPTYINKEIARENARNKGRNVVVTGYPACDVFLDENYKYKDNWKPSKTKLKKVIWAPHHTIEVGSSGRYFSTFLSNHQLMLELCDQFHDKVQFAFKPHPGLKNKLYQHPAWGKRKTDEYYKAWAERENGQVIDGEYEDLFLSSDAMLLDSVSFMTEYCYTGKPSCFLLRREKNDYNKSFNRLGTKIFDLLYKATSYNEIVEFIENIVLKQKDPMAQKRIKFIKSIMLPPNNKTAVENIFDNIYNAIKS